MPHSIAAIRSGRTRAALLAFALLVATPADAQQRADTLGGTLLRAVHPWLGQGGSFTDVQRIVTAMHGADSDGDLRWTTVDGAARPAALATLAFLARDPDASAAQRADAVALKDSLSRTADARRSVNLQRALFDVGVDILVARNAFVHRQGLIDPTRVHVEWSLQPAEVDLAAVRASLLEGRTPAEVFASLEPQTESYQRLVRALAAVRAQDADTAQRLPAPPKRTITTGARYTGARPLARVLVALGELPPTFPVAGVRNVYTRPMSDAVSRWYNRKLKKGRVNGALSDSVLAALLDEYHGRADRIAMAIERWRWLPRTFSNDPLVVNLPEFRLQTYARFEGDSADPLGMNVVIGRADSNATPVFAANMTLVVFSPQWHVPKSIMLGEILPAATADPGYLAKHDYELTTGTGRVVPVTARNIAKIGTGVMVRQKSGDDNSLGKVKFLLPNPYDIYLHDTPARTLFSRTRRDFSHGCVRLGDPMALARYVLGSQPVWTDSKITEAMDAGVERYVRVPKPIPVLIVYQTAVAGPTGAVRYFNDVYGHDRTLADAFAKVR